MVSWQWQDTIPGLNNPNCPSPGLAPKVNTFNGTGQGCCLVVTMEGNKKGSHHEAFLREAM